ncbi:hypothetical protein D3C87_1665010 [compost metagenome]
MESAHTPTFTGGKSPRAVERRLEGAVEDRRILSSCCRVSRAELMPLSKNGYVAMFVSR